MLSSLPINALLLKGSLVLSPQNPIVTPMERTGLWLSNSKTVRVSHLRNKAHIVSQNPGLVHLSGLSNTRKVQRILSISDQNFLALKKCGAKSIRMDSWPLEWSDSVSSFLEQKRCHFGKLKLTNFQERPNQKHFYFAEKAIESLGLRIVDRRWVNKRRVITILGDSSQVERAKNVLGSLQSFYEITNRVGAKPGNSLKINLSLIEWNEQASRRLGILPPTKSAFEIKKNALWLVSEKLDGHPLLAYGEYLQSKGLSRVIAKPQLRLKLGKEAVFQSGGEIPIKHREGFVSKTLWKPYGLNIKLKALESDIQNPSEISIDFNVELSEPDFSRSVEGTPSFHRRKLSSQFDIRAEENFLLGSLIKIRRSKSKKGLWGFSDLPLLDFFFSTSHEENEKNQLWFLIKASWIENSTRNIEKRLSAGF